MRFVSKIKYQTNRMKFYFTLHILEALQLNIKRFMGYARLNLNCMFTSFILIFSEILILPFSLCIDALCYYWQKKGVPILKYEFVDISEAASFSGKYPENLNNNHLIKTKISFLSLIYMINQMRFESNGNCLSQIKDMYTKLNETPRYYCMTRHLVESLYRVIYLGTAHIRKSKELNVVSPAIICRIIATAHVLMLPFGYALDLLAYNCQITGIPILYNDLPKIKLEPDLIDLNYG